MGRKRRCPVFWSAMVLTIPACGVEVPRALGPSDVSPEVRRSAITLVEAIEKKIVEIAVVDTESTTTDLAVRLTPLVETQPWICIHAGWLAKSKNYDKEAFISYQPLYVRMTKRIPYTVDIPHLQLHRTKGIGIPYRPTLSRLEDARTLNFLAKLQHLPWTPGRRVLQFAVWALFEDVPYAELRRERDPTDGKPKSDRANITPVELQKVADMLERAGHQREKFALWRDALDALGERVRKYEQLCEANDPEALTAFEEVCRFYPIELATRVLVGAFDVHSGDGGKEFRQHAIRTLARRAGKKEMEIIREREGFEENEDLHREIREILEKPARPGK